MSSKLRHSISSSDKIWSIVELVKQKRDLTDWDLAKAAEVSDRTVRNDRTNPDKIPVGRLLRYLSFIMTDTDVLDAIYEVVEESI